MTIQNGLIAALIALVIIAGVSRVGVNLEATFAQVADTLHPTALHACPR